MKIHLFRAPCLAIGALLLVSAAAFAQKPGPKPKAAPKPVIFAVLDGGKRVEPIAAIDGVKLVEPGAAEAESKAFAGAYYKPGASYSLVFGGAADGKLSIVKSNIGTECGGSSAASIAKPVKAKIAGLVMALATNAKLAADSTAYRRRPTPEERAEIEKLVRAEFTKNGVSAAALKNLRYHNLTALDVDGDDQPEFVGSYWIAPAADERRLLFFIAERDPAGKLAFSVSDYSAVKPDDVMSGDVKDLDTGIGHELLLDVLDVDSDGIREIFTIGQAFEGNNYYVYKRTGGEWTKVHETYSYRCAY
jgi:hypothetical protein